MTKIKLASVNSTTFTAGGKAYLKGDYDVEYDNASTDETTGLVTSSNVFLRPKNYVNTSEPQTQKFPWKNALPWTAFLDSTETAYADFDTFTVALANLVAAPSNASTSDLISDTGTITQITSKTTGVTLSVLNGIVTTVALSDAADTSFDITITNTKATTTSNIQITSEYAGTTGCPYVYIRSKSSGSFVVRVTNIGTAVLNALMKIQFLVVN